MDWENRHRSLTISPWVALKENVKQAKMLYTNTENMFQSSISAGTIEKLPCSGKLDANISSWSYGMEGHEKKYVERILRSGEQNNSTVIQSRNAMHG